MSTFYTNNQYMYNYMIMSNRYGASSHNTNMMIIIQVLFQVQYAFYMTCRKPILKYF